MDSGRVGMSQEWSRVVSAEVKKEYYLLPHSSKVSSSFELDMNASQAC